MHGSINWKKTDDKVCNDFNLSLVSEIQQALSYKISSFPAYKETNEDILKQLIGRHNFKGFIDAYNKMLLVNPTKKKFSETVFDVHLSLFHFHNQYIYLKNIPFHQNKRFFFLLILTLEYFQK